MKHLLTAALIATALASPVMGEVTHLSCANLIDSSAIDQNLYIDTDSWSAHHNQRPLDLLSVGDTHISWTYEGDLPEEFGGHFVAIYLLNRDTLILTLDSVSLGDYKNFRELDYIPSNDYFQCRSRL